MCIMWIKRRLLQLLCRKKSNSHLNSHLIRRSFILGIETSCDDTGLAILNSSGTILGECIYTQNSTRFGGVIPSFAMGFHAEALPKALDSVIEQSSGVKCNGPENLRDRGIEAIAVTNKPGLSGSLSIGLNFAKYLCLKNKLPMIPIHHMEAHALTPRMEQEIPFPYVVLLVSGGHCLLSLAENVNTFKLLGKQLDNAPGEIIDKIARRLKLHMLSPDLRDISGGRAIETVGEDGDPYGIAFNIPLRNRRSCDFSFGGYCTHVFETISKIESEVSLEPDAFLPDLPTICASVEYGISKQLCERLQRGIEYLDLNNLWEKQSGDILKRNVVISGGVASNQRMRSMLTQVCDALNCRLVAPAPKYCTDNGVMIAWNGLEKHRISLDVLPYQNVKEVTSSPREPFGIDISSNVEEAYIKCKWIKVK